MLDTRNDDAAPARQHCVFSCSEKICVTLDKAGVPDDPKWRSLILYIRGLRDYDCLTGAQKGEIQSLVFRVLQSRDFSERNFQDLVKKQEHILSAPYREKLEEALDESARLLQEFQLLLLKRKGDVQRLGVSTIGAVQSGKEPQQLIAELRSAFLDVVSLMEEDAAHLDRLSKTDALTGLNNRRAFDEYLTLAVARARQEARPLSFMFLDIDLFKRFNDTYGHRIGDQALATVAKIIKETNQDFQARYGGEEFAIVMPATPIAEALARAEAIRRRIEAYNFVIRNNRGALVQEGITITVSIGVAQLAEHEEGGEAASLLDAADKALYAAKEQGRNRVCEAVSFPKHKFL